MYLKDDFILFFEHYEVNKYSQEVIKSKKGAKGFIIRFDYTLTLFDYLIMFEIFTISSVFAFDNTVRINFVM